MRTGPLKRKTEMQNPTKPNKKQEVPLPHFGQFGHVITFGSVSAALSFNTYYAVQTCYLSLCAE